MYIQLAEVLKQMETRHKGRLQPFSISFFTADRTKRTGGELVELVNVALYVKEQGGARESADKIATARPSNHYTNATRNILTANGDIRKIHIRLIEEFNGQKVHW